MPNRRNYGRSRRRKRYISKPKSKFDYYAQKTGQALAVAYGVKRLLNVERKVVDLTSTTVTPAPAGTATLLNGLAQGDGDNQRDGSSCKVVRLGLKGRIVIDASATNTQVRVMLVQKKHNDGLTITLTDLMSTTGANAFYSKDGIHNFKVLMDKRYVLSLDSHQTIQLSANLNMNMNDINEGLFFLRIYNNA